MPATSGPAGSFKAWIQTEFFAEVFRHRVRDDAIKIPNIYNGGWVRPEPAGSMCVREVSAEGWPEPKKKGKKKGYESGLGFRPVARSDQGFVKYILPK